MSNVLILGAGLAGLTAAALLARDGHEVTVLEKDPAPAPADSSGTDTWSRPGAHQFGHIHLNLARWLQLADLELPELSERLLAAGGLRLNLLKAHPAADPVRYTESDRRFETVTARRPVLEAVLAHEAEGTPGVRIIRGERVTGLIADPDSKQVSGVRTDTGEWRAELTVDATGRRSAMPLWLKEAGLPPATEHSARNSTVYYSRHFKSAGGTVPELKAATLQPYDGVSIITLPADNGTWSVAIQTHESDHELRQLRNPAVWSDVLAQYPLAAHWDRGNPLSDDVQMIAALHDRSRSLVSEGGARTSGLVLLGDAWACSDPSLGRGSTMSFRHAQILRDTLRTRDPVLDGVDFTSSFEHRSDTLLGPINRRSWWFIRNRLAELAADAVGQPAELGPDWQHVQVTRGLEYGDADLARGFAGVAYLLQTAAESFDNPQLLDERVESTLRGDWNRYPLPGPTRAALLSRLAD